MKRGAVINSASGTLSVQGSAGREQLQERLSTLMDPTSIRFVEGNSAQRAARELVENGVDVLIAGGGDGTIGAIAAVAVSSGVPLGVLPLGTLNHFARDLGIPADLPAAVEIIRRMHTRRVDLGEVNGRMFLNNVSLGMYPALVTQREKYRQRHGWKKLPAHLLAAWQVFLRFPVSSVSVELDQRHVIGTTPVLLVANNAYDGGLLADAKRQALDTGKVWVCMARTQGTLALIRACWGFITGSLDELPELETQLVESLTVRPRKRKVGLAIDGETCRMAGPLRIKSLPGALEAIVP